MGRRDRDDLDARAVLAGLVDEELLEAYVSLLRKHRWAEPETADMFDSRLAQRLTDEGMAVRQAGASGEVWLTPTPPTMALMARLVLHGQRTVAAQEQLLAGHRRLADLQRADYEGAAAGDMVEIITDPATIQSISTSLVVTAREHWMSLENTKSRAPLKEALLVPPPVAEGVESRTIYDKRCLENPVGVRMIRAAVAQGEAARWVPCVPMKMKLADEAAALLPLDPTGLGGAMVVRAPVVLKALRDYFDLLWATGIPIGPQASVSELNEAQSAVLQLLVEDFGGEDAIARNLGMSPRTVRRHVDHIRQSLGVEGRCALGAAAVRRGWVA